MTESSKKIKALEARINVQGDVIKNLLNYAEVTSNNVVALKAACALLNKRLGVVEKKGGSAIILPNQN